MLLLLDPVEAAERACSPSTGVFPRASVWCAAAPPAEERAARCAGPPAPKDVQLAWSALARRQALAGVGEPGRDTAGLLVLHAGNVDHGGFSDRCVFGMPKDELAAATILLLSACDWGADWVVNPDNHARDLRVTGLQVWRAQWRGHGYQVGGLDGLPPLDGRCSVAAGVGDVTLRTDERGATLTFPAGDRQEPASASTTWRVIERPPIPTWSLCMGNVYNSGWPWVGSALAAAGSTMLLVAVAEDARGRADPRNFDPDGTGYTQADGDGWMAVGSAGIGVAVGGALVWLGGAFFDNPLSSSFGRPPQPNGWRCF